MSSKYQSSTNGCVVGGDGSAMPRHHKGITQGLCGGGTKTMFLKTLGIKCERSANETEKQLEELCARDDSNGKQKNEITVGEDK